MREKLQYHAYIVMQHELMVENPKLYSERGEEAARHHSGYELAAMGMGTLKIHNSELIPFPAPIKKREDFAKWSRNACTTLYLAPAIVAGVLLCWNMWVTKSFTLFQGVCMVVSVSAVINQQRASAKNSGLFYLIDSLENSISEEKRIFRNECFDFYENMKLGDQH